MRKWTRMLALAALLALTAGCGAPVRAGAEAALSYEEAAARVRGDGDAVCLFAANVGKGDALILRVGDWTGLIDTGKTWARGRVASGLSLMGVNHAPGDAAGLDALFITHTDKDHVGGLDWMAAESDWLPLRGTAICAPAMYTDVEEEEHPAVLAAGALGLETRWLRRGDMIPLGDTGATLRVLAPNSLYRDKDDNNSLVLLLESPQGRMLLTGDMELPEEAELLSLGDDLACAVLKVPNHGDNDTTSGEFARRAAAQIALISTDSREKPGTPDPGVVSRLEAAGSRVVVTEGSGLGVLVTLKGGVADARPVDFGASPVAGLSIAGVDASDDRITLQNTGDAAVGLWGFYLFSEKGDELFAFPDGASVAPGETLTVGTRSTEGRFDLLWDDKKVVNRKKADAICLYDPWGRLLDRVGNGL